MKKTYIKPMNIIESADLMDDVMISGSTAGEQIIEGGGDYTGEQPVTPGAREVVPGNIWDDAW